MVRPYGVIALLAPAAMLAVLRWRATDGSVGVAFAVVAALCLWFHLATAPLCRGLRDAVDGDVVSRVRGRLGRGPRVAPRDLAIAAAPRGPRRRVHGAGLAVAARPLRRQERHRALLVRAGAADRSSSGRDRRRDGGAHDRGLVLVAAAVGAPSWRAAGAARALPDRGGARAVGRARGPGADRTAQPDHPQSLPGRHLAAGAALVAAGLAEITDRIATHSSPAGGVVAPALLFAMLVAGGPFADATFRRSSFQHSKDFIRFDEPRRRDRRRSRCHLLSRRELARRRRRDRRVPVSWRLERDALALRLSDDPSRAGDGGGALRLAVRRAAAVAQPCLLAAARAAREPGAVPRRPSRSAG